MPFFYTSDRKHKFFIRRQTSLMGVSASVKEEVPSIVLPLVRSQTKSILDNMVSGKILPEEKQRAHFLIQRCKEMRSNPPITNNVLVVGNNDIRIQNTILSKMSASSDVMFYYPDSRLDLSKLNLSRYKNLVLLDQDVDKFDTLKHVSEVHAFSSDFSIDAVLFGRPLTVHYLSFMSGWGWTKDMMSVRRNKVEDSSFEHVLAAYLREAHYTHPYTGNKCEIEDIIAIREAFLKTEVFDFDEITCMGITPWKRSTFSRFLNYGNFDRPKVQYKSYSTFKSFSPSQDEGKTKNAFVAWASSCPDEIKNMALEKSIPLFQAEDGFLRSSGLGIKLALPGSLAFSKFGIHYDSTTPSELEYKLNTHEYKDWQIHRARELMVSIIKNKVAKYGGAQSSATPWPHIVEGKRKILVIGQVEDDASLKKGSPVIYTNLALIQQVRALRPNDYIAFKPHPDVESGLRLGKVDVEDAKKHVDIVLSGVGSYNALEDADEVHVMSSQTGLEALMLGKRVVCHGIPFYSGWGLTEDVLPCERRTRKLTIEELIYTALIDYPYYIDPVTGLPCTPEVMVDRITNLTSWPHAPGWMMMLVKAKRIFRQVKKKMLSRGTK